jgi:hypothetical protein
MSLDAIITGLTPGRLWSWPASSTAGHLHVQGTTHRRSWSYDHSPHGQQQAPVLIQWWDGVGDGAQTLLMSPLSLVRLCRCIY